MIKPKVVKVELVKPPRQKYKDSKAILFKKHIEIANKRVADENAILAGERAKETRIKKQAILASLHLGSSIQASCEAAKISWHTFDKWCNEDKVFNTEVEATRRRCIKIVEDALFRLATGYVVDEPTTYFQNVNVKDKDGKPTGEKIEVVTNRSVKRLHIHPQLGAQAFYLCNRAPKEWQHIQRVVLRDGDKDNDLAQLLNEGIARLNARREGKNVPK